MEQARQMKKIGELLPILNGLLPVFAKILPVRLFPVAPAVQNDSLPISILGAAVAGVVAYQGSKGLPRTRRWFAWIGLVLFLSCIVILFALDYYTFGLSDTGLPFLKRIFYILFFCFLAFALGGSLAPP